VAQLELKVDGQVTGTIGIEALGPGESRERCDETGPFGGGIHTLTAVVDGPDQIAEINETNNERSTRYAKLNPANLSNAELVSVSTEEPGAGPPGPGLTLEPSTRTGIVSKPEVRADLIVESISLRGNRGDCDPGRNDLRVTVKNQGAVDAVDIVVKLVVDNNPDLIVEKSMKKLEAGESDSVDFDDVSMRGGERRLTASVETATAEAQENNNSRSVTLRCTDE